MFARLKNEYWKRWIRRHGCKLAGGVQSLGKGARLCLETGVELGHIEMRFSRLEIGAYSYMRSGGELQNIASIGRFCSIGSNVLLGQERNAHPVNWVSSHPFQFSGTSLHYQGGGAPARIGHDVWIGRDALVMEGVEIGIGCIVAARSVVTKSLPPYSIAAGVPARIVAQRHPDTIAEKLLDTRWWESAVADLVQLPLADPVAFLRMFEDKKVPTKVEYQDICIRRDGCQVL